MSLVLLIVAIVVLAIASLVALGGVSTSVSIVGLLALGLVFFAASFLPLGSIRRP